MGRLNGLIVQSNGYGGGTVLMQNANLIKIDATRREIIFIFMPRLWLCSGPQIKVGEGIQSSAAIALVGLPRNLRPAVRGGWRKTHFFYNNINLTHLALCPIGSSASRVAWYIRRTSCRAGIRQRSLRVYRCRWISWWRCCCLICYFAIIFVSRSTTVCALCGMWGRTCGRS